MIYFSEQNETLIAEDKLLLVFITLLWYAKLIR